MRQAESDSAISDSANDVTGVFYFDGDAPRVFSAPKRVIQAFDPAAVLPALDAVQQASLEGYFAAGYIAYEAAGGLEPHLQTHPASPGDPLVWFALFETSREPDATSPQALPQRPASVDPWHYDTPPEVYAAKVAHIREQIAAGVTYQTNYAVRLTRPSPLPHPYAHFEALRRFHQPPFACFLATGEGGRQIVSLSPELFVRLDGKTLTTRPMKGTAPRGRFPEEDASLAAALLGSEKERAENLMIVDLLRNDVGKVARLGSVKVPELFTLETYPTFHTLTSTIQAELAGVPEKTRFSRLMQALFPCGSVTGAPKVSTMAVIRGLEPTPRGVYCGALGYLKPGGDFIFSVPIRTLEQTPKGAVYGVGSGITWDARPAAEAQELRVKSRLMQETPPAPFSLLETMRWDGQKIVRLDRHLRRLKASASYFQFAYDQTNISRALQGHLEAHPNALRRVRLLLAKSGTLTVESFPFAPEPADNILKVALAKAPVNSQDVFLFHKTTHRRVYEARRQDAPDAADVLLFNERGELTEFTIGNLVVELDGEKLTPKRECGLLNGVLRQVELESGEVREAVLKIEDARRATRLWRVNSLRGWIMVEIV